MDQVELGDSPETALLALAARASGAPIWLHLLVADRCNHTCLHCYQVQGLKGELSREQIEDLLREFHARGGFVVSFSGGEATLRDDLIPLLAYAHQLGLATVLYTNGFSMTEELASAIAACHVWRVEISLYSDRPEEHDTVTRVPGSWAKTVQGVRWLRERRVNVILKFTATSPSTANAERLAALARELDSSVMISELVNAGEAGRSAPTESRRAADEAIGAVPAPESQQASTLDSKPCGAGGNQLRVRSDGQVQPCSQLQVSMGQIGVHAAGLAEAAKSEVARFFNEVTWSDLHGCRDCDLRVHCTRCFASAVAEAGDMLAPYRAACELAVARYRRSFGRGAIVASDAGCAVDRSAAVGPYRVDSDGNLRLIPDQNTPHDQRLVERHPWLRASREDLESAACGVDPARQERGLVQLRRQKAKSLDATRAPT
jgi:radical SAM protein with 4Fe4S-binding SPASM domain